MKQEHEHRTKVPHLYNQELQRPIVLCMQDFHQDWKGHTVFGLVFRPLSIFLSHRQTR
jgi:hypothetical protein